MLPLNLKIFIIATLTIAALSQSIYFHSPQQLKDAYPNGIKVRLSPIGFNPRSGQLDGTLVMASPFDACSPISNVQNEEEDVFVLANDETCLESIKSRNILKSGALMGIIKQNVNTTMHDKELDIVHIPIIQLSAQAFDNITKLLTGNTSTIIMASIKFGSDQIMREITTQLWMSPTQTDIYTFLINMEKFFNNQENQVNFIPRYAMHSQKDRKSFIGCYSNGMYCPGELQYDGKIEGQNVIEESLRQVIIRGMSLQKWWSYIKYYYVQCLHNSQGDVFWSEKSLQICTRNSMMLAEIDYAQVEHQMSQSFMGPRKQVDDNIWLHEQRKDYIKQKISQYPVLLINKKEFTNFNENEVKLVICKMEHNRSQECSQLMDGKLHNSEVFLIMGIVMVIIVLILIGYKVIMYKRMQTEMKSQVTSTLEQYYRYMETLEGDESQPKIYKGKPDSAIDIKHDSTKQNQQTQQSRQVEIQMTGSVNPQKKRKNTKEGHETLVEEQQN